MNEILLIEKAIGEIEARTLGVTRQFLEIHKVAYVDGKPKVARVDTEKENEAIVYFNVEGERFFLAVYIDVKPGIEVRWINTEPYHSICFRALSETLSLKELAALTTLVATEGVNRGDLKRIGGETGIVWKSSIIDFEPNPEADEFEDKLTKLLDYLEQDKLGVGRLVSVAKGYIQVHSSFHNGNTLIGGYHIDKMHIQRMCKLNLEIDFDISADGNFFNE